MKKIFSLFIKPLASLALMLSILAIVASSLLIYDTYQNYQDRKLGVGLVQNLELKTECKLIVNPESKFDLKFTFSNKNAQPLNLGEISIDETLVAGGEAVYTKFLETVPPALQSEEEPLRQTFKFREPVQIPAKGKTEVLLKMQAASKQEAKATAHTIVIYRGEIFFFLQHQIQTSTPCEIHVRYP